LEIIIENGCFIVNALVLLWFVCNGDIGQLYPSHW